MVLLSGDVTELRIFWFLSGFRKFGFDSTPCVCLSLGADAGKQTSKVASKLEKQANKCCVLHNSDRYCSYIHDFHWNKEMYFLFNFVPVDPFKWHLWAFNCACKRSDWLCCGGFWLTAASSLSNGSRICTCQPERPQSVTAHNLRRR